MTRILSILALLFATPALARDFDSTTQMSFTGMRVDASYLYGNRKMVERLFSVYCENQFGKTGVLGQGACTKMLPLEANRCSARGNCQ
jgi:hypothetical protein